MTTADEYDCLIIGGGPAGSTVASLLAAAGRRVVVVERERFPRYHVGEALLPAAQPILTRLGVWDQLQDGPFLRSAGVQFVSASGQEVQPFLFSEVSPGCKSAAWQVDRAAFDQMLLHEAVRRGAEARLQTRVTQILWSGDRAIGARVECGNDPPQDLRARVVVDAAGQQSVFAQSLNIRQFNPALRKAAIWGYYQAARRSPGPAGTAATILCTRTRDAWFWYLPLANDLTSVGVVGDAEYLIKGRGRPANVFEEELVNCPAVTERLASARFVSKFHVARDFAYRTQPSAGHGWVLAGDAFGFVDPLFSFGLQLALQSGEMAAEAIAVALAEGDTSPESLGRWQNHFSSALMRVQRLVQAFYTKEFSFSRFLGCHADCHPALVSLLMGEVFSADADRLLDVLAGWLEREARSVAAAQ